ncbi:MAG: hypothetical protein HYS66_14385 [Deltaproteobacteria bacterium]|nr:hypothetical protein [Deltaproteobacteria bacterium]
MGHRYSDGHPGFGATHTRPKGDSTKTAGRCASGLSVRPDNGGAGGRQTPGFSIWLLGFSITIPLMVFTYLKIQSNEKWLLSLSLTAIAWGFFHMLFVRLLTLPFPEGKIITWLGLS